jgi:hypothetical protein
MEGYGCVKFTTTRPRDVTTFAYEYFSTIYLLFPLFHERAGEHEVDIVCELLLGCFEHILLT